MTWSCGTCLFTASLDRLYGHLVLAEHKGIYDLEWATVRLRLHAQDADAIYTELWALHVEGKTAVEIASDLNRRGLRKPQGAEWQDWAVRVALRDLSRQEAA